MGSDETAMAITGGPRVIDVFSGNGAPFGPYAHFFRGQIGSWRSLGVGMVVGSRLHRIRQRLGSPESSRGRSTPEKSAQFGPDGAPFPSKTSIN